MWDSGLIDEKLEFELSRDDDVLALSSGMNDTPYNAGDHEPSSPISLLPIRTQ